MDFHKCMLIGSHSDHPKQRVCCVFVLWLYMRDTFIVQCVCLPVGQLSNCLVLTLLLLAFRISLSGYASTLFFSSSLSRSAIFMDIFKRRRRHGTRCKGAHFSSVFDLFILSIIFFCIYFFPYSSPTLFYSPLVLRFEYVMAHLQANSITLLYSYLHTHFFIPLRSPLHSLFLYLFFDASCPRSAAHSKLIG